MLFFSFIPALQSMRAHVSDTLRQSGRTMTSGRQRQWLRSGLATTQVALALALLFGSALAITAADSTVNGALGFDKHNVLVGTINLPEPHLHRRREAAPIPQRCHGRHARDSGGDRRRRREQHPVRFQQQRPAVLSRGRRTAAVGGPIRQLPHRVERLLQRAEDSATARALVRGQRSARHRAGRGRQRVAGAALLARTRTRSASASSSPHDGPWFTVVGVSGDVVHNWFTRREDTIYRPHQRRRRTYGGDFAIRTVGDPTALAGDFRRAVAAMDPDQPIASLTTLEQMVEDRAGGLHLHRAGARRRRADRPRPVAARHLQPDGVPDHATHAGDRRAHGARRRPLAGDSRDQQARGSASRWSARSSAPALAFGVGQVMQSILFGLVTTSLMQLVALVAAAGGRGDGGGLSAGSPRGADRSDVGVARNVGTAGKSPKSRYSFGRGCPLAELFVQTYSPVGGSVLLSALVASLPPLLLAMMLAVLRFAPWRSAIARRHQRGAAGVARVGHAVRPDGRGGAHGMAFGLWPISWIVVSAVLLLQPVGGERRLRRDPPVAGAADRRSAHPGVLVAFCFGALIEGIAGFGAPVAITASMLAGLGFEPIMAAMLALIANTTPVAFGSLGIPITTLGGLLAPMLGRGRADHHERALGDGRTAARVLLAHHSRLPRRAVRGLEDG